MNFLVKSSQIKTDPYLINIKYILRSTNHFLKSHAISNVQHRILPLMFCAIELSLSRFKCNIRFWAESWRSHSLNGSMLNIIWLCSVMLKVRTTILLSLSFRVKYAVIMTVTLWSVILEILSQCGKRYVLHLLGVVSNFLNVVFTFWSAKAPTISGVRIIQNRNRPHDLDGAYFTLTTRNPTALILFDTVCFFLFRGTTQK